MLASITAPVTTILPGGCFPPIDPEPKPWERNCWDPTKWGVQLPSPDSEIQAFEAAKLLG